MPIGSDPLYREKQAVLERAFREASFAVTFPDYDPANPKFDLDLFLAQLRATSLVAADVTGERPSVYFELGLAQALGKPVLLLAEVGTVLHQHANDVTLVRYSDLQDLEKQLTIILKIPDPAL